jgi:hypothetical protein
MGYPVEWRGRHLTVSELTVGVKERFCKWLRVKLRADAEEDNAGYPAKLNAYLDGLRARVWWVADRMSPSVWEWMYKSHEGGRMYARLLLGVKAAGKPDDPLVMNDEDLDAFLGEKEADERSDYMLALAAVHADADPKAKARPESGSAPTGTSSTAAS